MLLLTEKIQNNQLEDSCDFSYQMEDLEFGCVEFFGGGGRGRVFFPLTSLPFISFCELSGRGQVGALRSTLCSLAEWYFKTIFKIST